MAILSFIPRVIRWVNIFLFGYPIVIRYKSGQKLRLRCKKFIITQNENCKVVKVQWEDSYGFIYHIGVEEIESTYSPVF